MREREREILADNDLVKEMRGHMGPSYDVLVDDMNMSWSIDVGTVVTNLFWLLLLIKLLH